MKKIQILALSALLLTMPLAIVEPVYAADGTKQEQQQKRPPRVPDRGSSSRYRSGSSSLPE